MTNISVFSLHEEVRKLVFSVLHLLVLSMNNYLRFVQPDTAGGMETTIGQQQIINGIFRR